MLVCAITGESGGERRLVFRRGAESRHYSETARQRANTLAKNVATKFTMRVDNDGHEGVVIPQGGHVGALALAAGLIMKSDGGSLKNAIRAAAKLQVSVNGHNGRMLNSNQLKLQLGQFAYIEDDVLVTESGHKVLGKPIPKTIKEVEDVMSKPIV